MRFVLLCVAAVALCAGLVVGFAVGKIVSTPPKPESPSTSAGSLRADQWRWATDEETYDVYVPTPCPYQVDQRFGNAPCERGIVAWRMGPGKQEKRDRDIEWVRVHRGDRAWWHPARSDLDPTSIVVFDGMEVHMAPIPAGGKRLGLIVVKE